MNYEQATQAIYQRGRVNDGYFGATREVGFAFDPQSGKTLVVADCGYYNSGLPLAIDQRESEWLLNHHPHAKRITL